jgi:macrolide transport system ATP-binding/permease protein
MTTLIQDVRYAVRQLRKTPGFTVTAVLTLAIGIGGNAAIFTLVNFLLLRNLPVANPKTLVRLGNENDCCVGGRLQENGNYSLFSTDTYQQFKKNSPEFEELAAMQAGFGYRPVVVRRDRPESVARSVMAEFVSGNYFRTFGLQPRAGRLFADADDIQGAPAVVVMSYQTWKRDYAAEPSIIGSTFWINTKPVTLVGIAPEGFFGDRVSTTPPNFYLPIETMPALANATYVHDPETVWLYMIGRAKPGIATASLEGKLSTQLRQIYASSPRFSGSHGKDLLARAHLVLVPGGVGIQSMQQQYGSNLHLLMWIAGLVLLIACANIANLLLVRGLGRRSEMSLRTALGAMRRRLIRQLLTECIVLAGIGGLIGLIVAYVGTRMLLMLAFPGTQDVPINASPSIPVIAFACVLSLLTGILFGVAPAFVAAQAQPVEALRSGARTTPSGLALLQRPLVVLQAALSLVLLIGAGLFSQSLTKLQNTDMKLDSTNRYIVHINPQAAGYSQTQVEALYQTMEERFHSLPGVVKVGIGTYTPMEDNNWGDDIQVQGQPPLGKGASYVKVNAEFFDSVGTRVVMGRGIGLQDTSKTPAVAVVNKSFVKTFFKDGSNPLGQHFGNPGPRSPADYEIVGVVEDTVYESVRWKDHSMFFVPTMQRPASEDAPIESDLSLYAGAMVLQTERPMNNMEQLARAMLSGINPNLSIVKFQTFDQQIADNFNDDRLIARLTTMFGALALLLATLGLYGVTAFTVERRTPEIGVRMALGAARGGVVAMVMRGAVIQTLLGLAIGVPIALLCVRFVQAQLYEIKGVSAIVCIGSIATLAIAAAIAGLIPARRAATIDPVQALRSE